jgi:hypothetical protein
VDAPEGSGARVNQVLAGGGIYASEIVGRTTSLESVFLHLTGGESGD